MSGATMAAYLHGGIRLRCAGWAKLMDFNEDRKGMNWQWR
jgi:hypothetical protein